MESNQELLKKLIEKLGKTVNVFNGSRYVLLSVADYEAKNVKVT